MQQFKNHVDKFYQDIKDTSVIIVGDVMLDIYMSGIVERISPEAPVPVLELQNKVCMPGGAANVALNINSMGAKSHLFSVIGNDESGVILSDILIQNNVDISGIIHHHKAKTTTKSRIISKKTQLLRVDDELIQDLSKEAEDQLLEKIAQCIATNNPKVIVLQDYNKGVLTKSLIERIIDLGNRNNVPIAVDPKKENFSNYKNITLFKPNLKEVSEGLGQHINPASEGMLVTAAKYLHETQQIQQVVITLSDKGLFMSYMENNKQQHFIFPAIERSISDVSGAGDTVISIIALGLAANLNSEAIAIISNVAGGLVCEKPGVVAIDKDELFEELQKQEIISKFISN